MVPPRFEINFLSETGDIVFHIKPRFSSATMVANAFQGGRWGQEEASSVFPLVLGEPFEVRRWGEPLGGGGTRAAGGGGPWGGAGRSVLPLLSPLGLRLSGGLAADAYRGEPVQQSPCWVWGLCPLAASHGSEARGRGPQLGL